MTPNDLQSSATVQTTYPETDAGSPLSPVERAVALYVFAIVGWPLLSQIILVGWLNQPGALGIYGPWIPGMFVGVAVTAFNIRGAPLNVPGVLYLALPLAMTVIFWTAGQGRMPGISAIFLLPIIVGWSDKVDPKRLQRLVTQNIYAVLIFIYASIMLYPSVFLGACRTDKCSLGGKVLVEPGFGNSIGVSLILLFPYMLFPITMKRRAALLLMVVPVIVLSGSRTALIGVLAMCGVWGARTLHRRVMFLLGGSAIVAALVWSLIPALKYFPPDSFTFRAALWIRARYLIGQNPLYGWGPSFWVRQVATDDYVANYSAHNIWLEVLVEFGIIGLFMAVIALYLAIKSFPLWETRIGLLVILLTVGATEAPIMPGRVGLQPAAVVLAFMFTSRAPLRHRDPSSAVLELPKSTQGGLSDRLQR